jgi:hypothetical protein
MLIGQVSTKYFLPLSIFSKIILYKNFSFYNLNFILPNIYEVQRNSSLEKKLMPVSWFELLFIDYFTYNFTGSTRTLRTQVIFFTNTYLYIDSGKKYTILKPKFRSFFSCKAFTLFRKEVLILTFSRFFSFFSMFYLYSSFKLFLSPFFKKSYSLPSKVFFSYSNFFLRKIFKFDIFLHENFFFYKLYNYKLSHYQKKINFLQFSIFFKNINILSLKSFFKI